MQFNLDHIFRVLDNTPRVIRSLLSDLPDELIFSNEGQNTWSPFDVVGHLIHGEKTDWMPRTEIILSNNENKKFVPFDRFAQFEESKGKTMADLINEFSELRAENVSKLKNMNIDEEKLNWTGIHPDFGEVTLRQLIATWAAHDFSHISQITRVLTKQYKDEMGRWMMYINVMRE